jgi:hypothetical protein
MRRVGHFAEIATACQVLADIVGRERGRGLLESLGPPEGGLTKDTGSSS